MPKPQSLKDPSHSAQIVILNNSVTRKEYDLIISNLLLEPWEGQTKMSVVCQGKSIESQGPVNFVLDSLGKVGSSVSVNFDFEISNHFKPGQQFFVIFEVYKKGNINENYSRTFTNFLLDEPKEAPPTFETAFA